MFASLEIRPVIEMKDSAESYSTRASYSQALVDAGASGCSFKTFHTLYGIDDEGLSEAIGDFDNEQGARETAIALGLPWSINGRNVAATRITLDEAETAMCVWEALLDAYQTYAFKKRHDDWAKALDATWERIGTAEMRSLALSLAAFVHAAYGDPEEALEVWGDSATFDWEFVPHALTYVDWETGSFPDDARERMLADWTHKPDED